MLKHISIYILRLLLRAFYIFPIDKDKIFFITFSEQYCCNPKYIFIDLYNKLPQRKYVWCLYHDTTELINYNIVFVKKNTIKWIYHILTSKVIITNSTLSMFPPYRKTQIVINTWHGGGAYKKVGVYQIKHNKEWYKKILAQRYFYSTDKTQYFISSCRVFSEVMHKSHNIPSNKYLPIGMPRNDILFKNTIKLKDEIRQKLNIPEDASIVLFAPTHRDGDKYASEVMKNTIDSLSIDKLRGALKEKFKGEFICLFKGHPSYSTVFQCNDTIDVSLYSDMQELLIISDVLITDYSSIIWDFSFTFKPCFLFTPDLDYYLSENRGFYTPIEQWPYPFAKTNEGLHKNILCFNQANHAARIKKHHEDMGSYEQGNATMQVTKLLQEVLA